MCMFRAGSLAKNIDSWKNLTSDSWILETVAGYKIELENIPHQRIIPKQIQLNDDQKKIIDKEIAELLMKNAISKSSDEPDQFISNIFIVEKKNEKFRPVINLKKLNEFIKYHHFKMETLETVLESVQKNAFFTSCDMTDAYFSIPVHVNYRKYLKFIWRNQLYHFNCLCFGIASAPRVFTKVMKQVFAYIRHMGISSFYYIDDYLFEAEFALTSKQHTDTFESLVNDLGFFINKEKSVTIPTTRIQYLGHIIDSVEFKVYLPEEKIEKIIRHCTQVLSSKTNSIRQVAR